MIILILFNIENLLLIFQSRKAVKLTLEGLKCPQCKLNIKNVILRVGHLYKPFWTIKIWPDWRGTMGEQWLLKQFCLNHPVEHIQKPKLPKLYVRVETSTSYFIIHNQFVKNCSLSDQLFCSIFLKSPSRQQSYQIIDCK